jgi:hypothetical protein
VGTRAHRVKPLESLKQVAGVNPEFTKVDAQAGGPGTRVPSDILIQINKFSADPVFVSQ